ncbi:FYVE and coiled-coil domain autophagy adaptor 1, partial [Balamuthia mandrillaris]
DAEQDTKEAVFTLAKASRINAASYRLKSILWGAGLGSGLGAVAGGALGLVGTPVAALILGAGGAATLGLAGGGLGHSVGSFIEKQINREVDKELITHHHRKVWVDDELCRNCMECGAEFTLFLRRHHCRICGGIFCASCCQHERELKYPGVEQPILQRICKHCAEHSPHSPPNSSTSASSSSS